MTDLAKDINQLGATATWTAAVRAGESARDDRLFDDPWAAALAGPAGMDWLAQRPPGSSLSIALRTRYFDDFLQRVCAEAGLRQVVLLAAGLDTRAYRLDWPPGTRLFELDQAPVLGYKETVLQAQGAQPACDRRTIPADLTGPWEDLLLAAGYDPGQPSAWLLEGFLFYLPGEAVTGVLERALALAAPGSALGFDIINGLTLSSPLTKSWVDMQAEAGAPWTGYLDDPGGLLSQHGWQATLTPIGAPGANYGRWSLPVIPAAAPGLPHYWFVTAEKV